MLHTILILNLQHFSDFEGGDLKIPLLQFSETFEQ